MRSSVFIRLFFIDSILHMSIIMQIRENQLSMSINWRTIMSKYVALRAIGMLRATPFCLIRNIEILQSGSHFVDISNRYFDKLSELSKLSVPRCDKFL